MRAQRILEVVRFPNLARRRSRTGWYWRLYLRGRLDSHGVDALRASWRSRGMTTLLAGTREVRISSLLEPEDRLPTRRARRRRNCMRIRVIPTVQDLNRQAAAHAADTLRRRLAVQPLVRLVAATGGSQLGFLEALTTAPGIEWPRVELFHLDEYLGLAQDHPASFSRFITDRIIRPTGIVRHHLIDGAGVPSDVMAQVGRELRRAPVDMTFVGIGENGHLAFNEPPADFQATEPFMRVSLDDVSRHQQVGGKWFARVEDVPTEAITMTIPQILDSREIICLAYGPRKAQAVSACFGGAPSPDAPASALATHANTTVYLDPEAAALLPSSIGA